MLYKITYENIDEITHKYFITFNLRNYLKTHRTRKAYSITSYGKFSFKKLRFICAGDEFTRAYRKEEPKFDEAMKSDLKNIECDCRKVTDKIVRQQSLYGSTSINQKNQKG